MAPAMDLSHGTRPKVMIAPPRLNLRRAASYQGEKAPTSSTSSRFNFNHLVFASPPPSPGLPALVPRPRKSSAAPRPSRVLRVLAWITGLAALLLLVEALVQGGRQVPVASWAFQDGEEYETIRQNELPTFPTPITVTDRRGKSKWTVSIPPSHQFPLSMEEYSNICTKCQEVATRVKELHGISQSSQQTIRNYYYEDPYFMDVRDAEKSGLLPGTKGKAQTITTPAHDGRLVGQRKGGLEDMETCRTSMTFVLESSDAGLGPTLMMLWTAYGLAQKEKRAFFIEDSRWAYGEYADMFKSSPMQSCKPPPRHQMLPCPRNAKHLVVSATTARETFGDSFITEYENTKRSDIDREREIYELARVGYKALFRLNDDDRPYVNNRVKEIKAKASVPQGNYNDGTIIGVHVRQGDLHPLEYQYNGAYIPLDQYVQKFQELIEERHNSSTPLGGEDVVAKQHSFMVVASDNPDVYEADEFKTSFRAQEQIKLAGKQHAQVENLDPSAMHKFVDEAFGWEGGFFASMFWNLGRTTLHNADRLDDSSQESEQQLADAMRLRGLIGRAYVMDLAVLAEASDTVICTMSAMGCRLLAVMMGWDKAMARGNWVNIDGDYSWTGITLS
ncbi:hypothetical protein FHL15_001122 [Xylaria flabelliformis]|uniref:GT23 domain-containing protein n=1 Tax=Xylaria flabelliformis TaxID=2512241 RepID=A0A553ICI4_9PEZI|nr:hypothetical protein FHL15_001122 [Xylaria flabelliformis]